jgi:hypothetical protein
MNLPGFSAEASLNGARAYTERTTADPNSAISVVPATCSQDYEGPCINGWQWVCIQGYYPRRVRCFD